MLFVHSCRVGSLAIGLAVLTVALAAQGARAQEPPKIQIVLNVPHSQGATSVAFSGDGTRAVSGSRDKTIKLWDVGTGDLLRNFEGHADGVTSVSFSPDGTRLLSGSRDKTLKLWDAAKGDLLRSLEGHTGQVTSVAFSPDGAQVLSGSVDKTLKLWDAATGQVLRTFDGHADRVTAVAFSSDAKLVVSGSADQTLKLWDAATGQEQKAFKGHAGGVTSVAFSPDGKRVLSGSSDKTLKSWDAATGRVTSFQGHAADVTSVAWSPDGKRALSGSNDKTLRVWDAATARLLGTFQGQLREVSSVAYSPDGARVISGGRDNTPKLWDATSRELLATFGGGSDVVSSVAFSPDSARVISGGRDGTLQVWDAAKGELLFGFEGHADEVASVAFSPEGKQVLSGSKDKTLKLWDPAKGELVRSFEGHADAVASVAFSPDGRLVLSGSADKSLRLWDVNTGQAVRTFAGHAARVNEVAFSPDGKSLLSGSGDMTLKLWDASTGAVLRNFEGHKDDVTSVAFSPDAKRIASSSRDKTIRLWDPATGEVLRTFQNLGAGATSVAFSPDSARLLAGTWDNKLILWDVNTEEPLSIYDKGHSGPVMSVAFSPNGKRMVSGSADTAVRIWDAAKPQSLSLAGLFRTRDGEWLTMIKGGFFAGSRKGSEMLSVVREFESFSVLQFYDHLYRPDLVEELLRGEAATRADEAIGKLNLRELLSSGPAPQVEYLRYEPVGNTVKLTMRIVDTGGGIGPRVVWRVNGKTQGNLEPAALKGAEQPSPGRAVALTEALKVDPGKANIVDFTAYNGAARVATLPFPVAVDKFGVTTSERTRMFVLAIGVDKYRSPDYQLSYAVKDTLGFGKALQQVAQGLYSRVQVKTLIDEQVTEANITTEFERIGAAAKATDVFVLFLAGHGKSINGRYHYYPQSLDFKAGQTGPEFAISQDKWQSSLLAKVGHVQKTLLILDTCESGEAAFVVGADGGRMVAMDQATGAMFVRRTESARHTAVEQLQYATGHNVIAASRQAAYEGYMGHGVLTYALLEALEKRRGQGPGGTIGVSRLADHVELRVPQITGQVFGIEQRPTRRLSGNDFPIGAPILQRVEQAIPKTPTHTLIRVELLRERATDDAPGQRELPAGTTVRVLEQAGVWVVVARGGQRIGYVRADAVVPLQ